MNPWLKAAEAIAEFAHRGQQDKAGIPYIWHVRTVAAGVESEDAKIVAFLHDVVEDTDWTLPQLFCLFPDNIINAVHDITRLPNESYKNFINRVSKNALATEVKLSDLEHNMQIERIPFPTQKDLNRIQKYKHAYATLKELQKRKTNGN